MSVNHHRLPLTFLLLLILWPIAIGLQSQTQASLSDNMEEDLAMATRLMTAKRSDTAIAITSQLLEKLRKAGQYDAPFGLKARLIHGSALIHADTNSTSYDFLWELKKVSKANKQWEIFAETCRVIASLLEYAERKEESLANLREAQAIIRQYQLDSIYPHFAVRISSWHRIFGDRDSSIFYANEAIRTAPGFGGVFEAASGHLILGLNYAKSYPEKAIFHFREGAKLHREIEEFTSYCSMHLNIVKLQLANGEPEEAMATLDSVSLYLPRLNENNIDAGQKARIYSYKGEVFEQLGQLDSAILYLKKGYMLDLGDRATIYNEKIVEIDNIYNVSQKTQELDSKTLEVRTEKERRNWLVIIALLLVLFAVALAYYITLLRKANEKTERQAEQLRNLDAAKSRFFANISHELRTPLTLVLGPINALVKENQLTEKQRLLLKMATRSGKELQHLVNEILDLGKLEFGKMEVQTKPTSLVPFFRKYLLQFESLAVWKQVRFDFYIDLPDSFTAKIDTTKCRQILYNLLSNAFKFTPAGREVKVTIGILENSADKRGATQASIPPYSNIQITVTDTGTGIHPDDLPHVFDRYFQTKLADAPATGGTGIGLAICQEYVRLLNGKIEVESTPGQETSFRLSFPVEVVDTTIQLPKGENLIGDMAPAYRSVEIPEGIPAASIIATDSGKSTILVVEDKPELQNYLRLILQGSYNVISAANGQVALEALRVRSSAENPGGVDLILSDLMMPVMDGYQLLEKLKSEEATHNIPVIMLTARAEKRDRLKALRIGVDDYLTKPFSEEELKVRIKNLLANHAIRKALVAETETEPDNISPDISQPDREWLKNFETFVQQNLSNNVMNVNQLAYQFAMSESTLLRQLKRLTGLSPQKYLQEIRLNESRILLENRQFNSIEKVASAVGYSDTRSFSRSFKGRFGKSPSEWLRD